MSLSVPALVWLATTVSHACPESMDFATSITLLLFCSQDAYTVFPSTGSTLICTSICPDPGGAMMRGDNHVLPLSLLITRNMVGLGHVGQPGMVVWVAFVYWGIRM